MAPGYRVTLAVEERAELKALTRAATKTTGKRFLYARALLLCDRGVEGPGWTVARVAEALGVSARTIERLKRQFVEQGLEFAPTEPIDGRTPASRHRFPKAAEVYCVPWSEWWITCFGWRRITAMASAFSTSSERRCVSIAQPTTRRLRLAPWIPASFINRPTCFGLVRSPRALSSACRRGRP